MPVLVENIFDYRMPKFHMSRTASNSRVHSPSPSLNFGAFTFVDNLTNKKITMEDAKRQYTTHRRESHQQLERTQAQKELNDVNEYISTLKTTKLFQMDSLRNKLFKSGHHQSAHTEGIQEHLKQTKRQLRDLLQASISEMSVNELRSCLADPTRSVDPHIMSLQAFKGTHLSKNELLKVVKGVRRQPKKKVIKPKRHVVVDDDPVEFKEEKELRERMDNYLNNTIRCNSSHLIRPNPRKELFQKLHKACASRKKINDSNFSDQASLEGEGVFEPFQKGEKIAAEEVKLKRKAHAKKLTGGEKEIIYSVENNLFFDLEVTLMMRPELIHAKDQNSNNLLHIAAKNRNEQLFGYLMKKAGASAMEARNNMGRTPVDLARQYGATSILTILDGTE